jgi:fumarate hydratase subunit alpha
MEANCALPQDVQKTLCAACQTEQSPVGQGILGDIVEHFTYAGERRLPICQDTGMAVVFADLGQEVHIAGGALTDAVNEGVRRGYTEGFLRKSVVSDPLRRVNTEDNTPAVLHLRLVPGDRLSLTVAPKGAGSENMTTLQMLKPSCTQEQVEAAIVEAVSRAGSNPCPPVVVGVGLGGNAEQAAELAKRALLRPLDEHHPDPFYAEMEDRVLEQVNRLGIGPQGLGGTTTALAVSVLTAPTHIAQMPLCVNLCCHVCRHACEVL